MHIDGSAEHFADNKLCNISPILSSASTRHMDMNGNSICPRIISVHDWAIDTNVQESLSTNI